MKGFPVIAAQSRTDVNAVPLRYRIGTGALWSVLGSGASQALALCGALLCARVLGAYSYGELALLLNTVSIGALLAAPSFGVTASRYVAEECESDPVETGKVIGTLTWASVILPALLCSVLFPVAYYFSQTNSVCSILVSGNISISLLLLFASVNSVQIGVLTGFEKFSEVAAVNLTKGAASISLIPLGAYYLGVTGALAMAMFASLVSICTGEYIIRKHLIAQNVLRREFSLATLKRVGSQFALPATASTLITLPILWWPNILLADGPGGLSELGIFNAGNQFRMASVILHSFMIAPVLPVCVDLKGKSELARLHKLVWTVSAITLVASIGYAVLVYSIGERLYILLGRDFSRASQAAILLSGAAIFSNTAAVFGLVFQVFARMWIAFWVNLVWCAIFLGGCVFASRWGASGVGWVFVVSYAVHMLIAAAISMRILTSRAPKIRETSEILP